MQRYIITIDVDETNGEVVDCADCWELTLNGTLMTGESKPIKVLKIEKASNMCGKCTHPEQDHRYQGERCIHKYCSCIRYVEKEKN